MDYTKIGNKYKVKPSLIKDEYEKFWKAVKKELSSPQELKISIPYFGVFLVQEGRLKRKVRALDKALTFYENRKGGVRDEKFKIEYLKQLEAACHLLKKCSTELTEELEICHKWLKQTTTPS